VLGVFDTAMDGSFRFLDSILGRTLTVFCPGAVKGGICTYSKDMMWENGEHFIRSVLSVGLPLILGLLIGMWLGKQQLRQNKSLATIISSWLNSVVSITKFWVKFQVGSNSSSSDGTSKSNGAKNDVYVKPANGGKAELKKNYVDTPVESGCDLAAVPKHIAIIMDGNRRYGKRMYGKGSMGHFDGGQKALQVIEWLSTEGCDAITLYAFSTENWNRESAEVDTLMGLFLQFVEDDLRPVVFNRSIRVKHICSDESNMPQKLHTAINDLVQETASGTGLTLNVCLSYGSRGEITTAVQAIATKCTNQTMKPSDITEDLISQHLLTSHSKDPDVLIRTSGEERISNFLLWQLAYTELFFLEKDWPELEKSDFLEVIRSFANGRQRRFGL
jgi:undecaprenyl diphosphate synthase